MKLKVGIADEHLLFVEGLKSLLEKENISIEWSVSDGKEVIPSIKANPVDLLILELRLPSIDGFDLIKPIKDLDACKVLVVSQYSASKFVKNAFNYGADGFLLKNNSTAELFQAIDEIKNGFRYMGENVFTGPQSRLDNDSPLKEEFLSTDGFLLKYALTNREIEVLEKIMDGMTNKEIASELFISIQTVSVHRKNIMKKLDVNNFSSLRMVVDEYKIL